MKTWTDVAAIAALVAVLTVSSTAMARDASQLVPIRPDPSSPQCVAGSVYGYTLEVCSGSYRISGQDLTCLGRRSHAGQHGVEVTLHRGHCNNGSNWFADSIRCVGSGMSKRAPARLLGARCTYFPNAAGRVGGFTSTRVVFYKSGL